jgi:Carboxypeptidase regulatory-like domain
MVRLETADMSQSDFARDDTTDDKGNFRLRNVPEGTYYVLAYQRDPGSRVYEPGVRQKVEVGEDNIEALTVSLLNTGATIQGKVKVDGSSSVPLDGLQLSLMPIDEDWQMSAHSEVKKDGSFEFKSVHDGSYAIRVWGLENDGYVKSARRGPDDLFEKGVQVEGGVSGKIELTVSSEGAKLEGSVTDGDGPVIGARVRLVPDPLTPYNHLRIHHTNTDQLGQFSLADIAPGKYKVTARRMITSEEAANKSEPQAVTLSEGEHKKIQIEFEKPQQP